MQVESIISFLGYAGVFSFAMSGLLAAAEKKLDVFGGFIIAFVTALGGGTLRDTLLNLEISWVERPLYIYIVIAGAITALVLKKYVKRIRKTLFLFDTIGIALFTITGVQIALQNSTHGIVILIFGVMTATFGGVIRDILCNEIPLIFRREIYATACIAGALCYIGLNYFDVSELVNTILSATIIITVRTLAVVKGYRFPLLNSRL